MYCIFISVDLKPGSRDRYLEVISENARASVRDEPGCHTFDVLADRENPLRFYLYEVYESPEALQAHKETPHYLRDRPEINSLIAKQEVLRADVLACCPPRRHAQDAALDPSL
ncbi:antibiotic biosynthesis monooxygenase [Marinobacterium nitratireducens]|uniref:Antibiotic biosynthesis monooxygenase n=1 Tax=Marinobacterium nitratireducens TaxID=518897 RepID=A0A917Z6D1_9GAMM|nr:putative quinol monooxygenase [Marinobacterium nitratireducens]GGO75681.1 antibiotic biosynthesis monooxygenase [Marinobacterium nitratireducens]